MFKLAVIGLDTSHSVVFTELIQGDQKMVENLQVVSCMRFPSPFQTEADQDARQEKMEQMGVTVTRSLRDAVSGVDGVMLEINDPALHLDYFIQVADLGLPVFLDKPLADTLENGRAICQLAREKGIPVWSSSSLRFVPEIIDCAGKVDRPIFCNIFGPLGQAAKGSSVVWYGVHSFEMLSSLMGCGAETVFARRDPIGVVAVVEYSGQRRAVVECNIGAHKYGGRAQNATTVESYITAGSPYPGLIKALEAFFIDGIIPVSLSETLEIQAMLEATEKSLASGKTEKIG